MLKYIFITVLLLQGGNSQPAAQKASGEQQHAAGQVSPTPGDNRQVEAGDKPNGTGDGEQAKQNDVTKSFQQTQINQYWLLVSTSIVTTVVLIVYTVFAGLQWRWIKKQAESTGDQVGKMQGQLDAIKKQSRIMMGTWQAVRRQAAIMEQSLKHTEKTVAIMKIQADASKLAAKAADESAKVARRSYELSAAPFVSVTQVVIADYAIGKKPTAKIRYTAGGSLTAHDIAVSSRMALTPENPFEPDYPEIGAQAIDLYLAPGQSFTGNVYASWELTEERKQQIADDKMFIYIYGKVAYKNRLGETFPPHLFCFRSRKGQEFMVYKPPSQTQDKQPEENPN